MIVVGEGFWSDFALAAPSCKIGNVIGEAWVMNPQKMQCEVHSIPHTEEGETLPVSIALNNASWSQPNAKTYYRPYGIDLISPNSGPSTGGTKVKVEGFGFERGNDGKCWFGVPGEYIIVPATFVHESLITCVSPKFDAHQIQLPLSVPFSVAFGPVELEPWTWTPHWFRYFSPTDEYFWET